MNQKVILIFSGIFATTLCLARVVAMDGKEPVVVPPLRLINGSAQKLTHNTPRTLGEQKIAAARVQQLVNSLSNASLDQLDEQGAATTQQLIADGDGMSVNGSDGDLKEAITECCNCTITTRYDLATTEEDTDQWLCTGNISDQTTEQQVGDFQFTLPQHGAGEFQELGEVTLSEHYDLTNTAIPGLRKITCLKIKYIMTAKTFALASGKQYELYNASSKGIESIPPLHALLQTLPQLLTELETAKHKETVGEDDSTGTY